MLTIEELKKLSSEELRKESEKVTLDLVKLQLTVRTRQTQDTAKLQGLRKYLARIKTMQRMMQMELESHTNNLPS
ncbi:50S ribosomal protein L29 [Candidatus Peregrinibacteria bacterium CG_4_9_14_0_2_um_filter_53_11]|nr:MAG: 50S ribosomal protein L29 [Candidatus Peregrinibacteria bacterium CG_4_9_14_0_2_um_filter_53_11]